MNSIENNFVPYQIALDMKSIGFDEPCFNYYGKNNKLPHQLDCMFGYRAHFNKNFCLAPLYQQAFRWFREKHGLISYIHPLALLDDDGLWCYEITDFSNNWDESSNIHSHEEAQLECLKKLIEICKKKE